MTYPGKSDDTLSNRVAELLKSHNIPSVKNNKRGWDHGCWIPLKLMYPNADIPVVQLSLKRNLNMAEHIALGKALSPLPDEGYLVIGR